MNLLWSECLLLFCVCHSRIFITKMNPLFLLHVIDVLLTERTIIQHQSLVVLAIEWMLVLFFYREGEEGEWNRTVETSTNSTSFTINDLNPFTIYFFKIEAKNLLGYSKPSLESYPTLTHRECKLIIFFEFS